MAELEYGETPVSPEFWFTEAGLYHTENYQFEDKNGHGWTRYRENILSVLFPKITIDVYYTNCKRETVFNPVNYKIDWYEGQNPVIKTGIHHTRFQCSRNQCKSDLYFTFILNRNGDLTKIGQHPSIADLIKPEINKYSKVLDGELISNWQRAIGLRAHGVGAGSYVYLRRIIEQMVIEAATEAITNDQITNVQYEQARWPDRIKLLKNYLPDYLVQNSNVYGVLSKGVHELSEDQCNDYFDVMHTSIEIICEEKLAALEREKKADQGSKALQKVLEEIKDSSS